MAQPELQVRVRRMRGMLTDSDRTVTGGLALQVLRQLYDANPAMRALHLKPNEPQALVAGNQTVIIEANYDIARDRNGNVQATLAGAPCGCAGNRMSGSR